MPVPVNDGITRGNSQDYSCNERFKVLLSESNNGRKFLEIRAPW